MKPEKCTACEYHDSEFGGGCRLIGRCFANADSRRPIWCPLDGDQVALQNMIESLEVGQAMSQKKKSFLEKCNEIAKEAGWILIALFES